MTSFIRHLLSTSAGHFTVISRGSPTDKARSVVNRTPPLLTFGDGAYAMEELIAELGSAYTMAHLELELTPRVDHAQYISHSSIAAANSLNPSRRSRVLSYRSPGSCQRDYGRMGVARNA
jgi:hypothetical protein